MRRRRPGARRSRVPQRTKATGASELAVKVDAALRGGGRDSEADAFAASWIKDHPKDDGFRSYLAQAAMAKKDYAAAARHYKALLESQPNNVLALNNMAWSRAS